MILHYYSVRIENCWAVGWAVKIIAKSLVSWPISQNMSLKSLVFYCLYFLSIHKETFLRFWHQDRNNQWECNGFDLISAALTSKEVLCSRWSRLWERSSLSRWERLRSAALGTTSRRLLGRPRACRGADKPVNASGDTCRNSPDDTTSPWRLTFWWQNMKWLLGKKIMRLKQSP